MSQVPLYNHCVVKSRGAADRRGRVRTPSAWCLVWCTTPQSLRASGHVGLRQVYGGVKHCMVAICNHCCEALGQLGQDEPASG